ncbi:hypothetical protein AB0C33_14080 [Nonomuraea sp. NPDC048881]|uniref:Uncharacterized protein n=1 Tax=Nonomuraea spiralis TaxID=46182 RepID=A0ABV5IXE2_9ACTN|nr:hypothetical protein [Nonomuraea spiralis]GGS83941.1 hypothetical protein GCM10010176_029470 [Nonomuraea spiralis]
MKVLRNALLGVMTVAAVLTASTAAYAEPAPAPTSEAARPAVEAVKPQRPEGKPKIQSGLPVRALNADGNFYVWSDDMNKALLYTGDAYNGWPSGWNNTVDVVWNNGYPGPYDDVNIYDYAPWSGSAYACIGNGDYWDLRRTDINYVFSWVNDGADAWQREPLGRRVHDNGSGHIWVDWCGNNNR